MTELGDCLVASPSLVLIFHFKKDVDMDEAMIRQGWQLGVLFVVESSSSADPNIV